MGGDFYDALVLPNGASAFVIGDVEGHGAVAAQAMGQLRGLIHSVLLTAGPSGLAPHLVLDRVDVLIERLGTFPTATVAYAELLPGSPGSARLMRYSTAGHQPLLVRGPQGVARLLDAEPDLLLGTGLGGASRRTHYARIETGSTVLAFTDGLVERRGTDIDVGLELLRQAVEAAPVDVTAEGLCEHLVGWFGGSADDAALLVIHVPGVAAAAFPDQPLSDRAAAAARSSIQLDQSEEYRYAPSS